MGLGLGVLLASLTIPYFLRFLANRFKRDRHPWLHELFAIANRPIQYLIWIAGAITTVGIACEHMKFDDLAQHLIQVRHVTSIVLLAWVLIRWRASMEYYYMEKVAAEPHSFLDKATIGALGRLANILIVFTAGYGFLEILQVPLKPLLALGGAGAIATGWAAKDIVANFFSGFMIFVTRPFAVGDWIQSPDKSIEGTVTRIGWYQTQIRSFERRPIYVPNSLFSNMVVVNPSRMTNRRIKHTVGVRYQDIKKVPAIVASIRTMLEKHPDIAKEQILMVHFMEFGAYSLDINIYCFTRTRVWKEWRSVQENVLLKVADIIDEHGASIAFPTSVVQLEREPMDPESV